MRCYRHRDYDAIAVCRHCGKAACADCCDDTGPAIACSTDCAAEVQQTYDLKRRLMQSFWRWNEATNAGICTNLFLFRFNPARNRCLPIVYSTGN